MTVIDTYESLTADSVVGEVPVFDRTSTSYKRSEVLQALGRTGYVVLRNLFSPDDVKSVAEHADLYLQKPSIAGATGYTKVDHPKKLLPSFMLGRHSTKLVLDEEVIDIIEEHMGAKTIMCETFFKCDAPTNYVYFEIHSDMCAGWLKSPHSNAEVVQDDMNRALNMATMVYLQDTTEGAFGFCTGTHLIGSLHGQGLKKYPKDERKWITDRFTRIEGLAGDLVIFDKRGFHGPDQPSSDERRAILSTFLSTEKFGEVQVAPIPVWTNTLGGLSAKQQRVLGMGAESWNLPSEYMMERFKSNKIYPLAVKLIENAYLWQHVKKKIKHVMGA